MNLGNSAVAALGNFPLDGSWMTLTGRGGAMLRPAGLTPQLWDRLVMALVPDSFWKPEFDENDQRHGRNWIVLDKARKVPGGKTQRARLTPAGMALVAHCAAGGKVPRQ
jgi:hypothetical protein